MVLPSSRLFSSVFRSKARRRELEVLYMDPTVSIEDIPVNNPMLLNILPSRTDIRAMVLPSSRLFSSVFRSEARRRELEVLYMDPTVSIEDGSPSMKQV